MRRVVVTGIGMINSVGNDKESAFKAICDGECGIDTITLFDAGNYSVKIAGEVKEDAKFVEDLGADSLDVVELVMALEEKFDIEIPDDEAEKITTVADVVAYVESK